MSNGSNISYDAQGTPSGEVIPGRPFSSNKLGELKEGYYFTVVIQGSKTGVYQYLKLVHQA